MQNPRDHIEYTKYSILIAFLSNFLYLTYIYRKEKKVFLGGFCGDGDHSNVGVENFPVVMV